MTNLDREYDIDLLAKGLGVAGPGRAPVAAIIDYCQAKISGWIPEDATLTSVNQLERVVCENLHLVIEEVWTDDDLQKLIRKYVALGEIAFAHLAQELDEGTFGALYERLHVNGRARDRYVAFVDCRTAAKAARRIFTRWHEISHALTLYQQLQLPLNRSRVKGSPIERMMDLIAGEFNFYSPLFKPVLANELHRTGYLTFAGVDRIRDEFYKEASFQSTLNACVRSAPFPAAVVEAALEHKKNEREAMDVLQGVLIQMAPIPKTLRLSSVAPNEFGRTFGLHLMLRVPPRSVISKVFSSTEEFSIAKTATENLAHWTHSDGCALPGCKVMVEARKLGAVALAIIQDV
jgi:hypothetical protein